MKKIRLFFLFILAGFATNSASGQIQQGNLMVGASLSDINIGFQRNNTSFSLDINPKAAYFISDNIALGGEFLLGLSTARGYTSFSYGIGLLSRYYISDPQAILLNHSRFFLEANFGISGQNHSVSGRSSSTNGLGIGFGPGLAYFITPNIGLEALLKYNLLAGFGSSATAGKLALGIGFQIYLPTKNASAAYNQLSNDLKKRQGRR